MPSRVRVLYFVGSFEQGGTERQVAELIANLPADRYEPHLAVCHSADQLGYRLPVASRTELGASRGPEPRTLVRLVRLVHALAPDIVHAFHDPQNSYARLAVRIAGRGKVIGSLRSTRLPGRTLRRERLTARLGAAVIVNSAGIADELLRARAGAARVHVVHNGVDVRRFRPLGADERARERKRFGMTGPTFVVPARVARQKNQLAVVRAVASMVRSGAWPRNARVILAGRPEPNTRYAWWVAAAARAAGVAHVVSRIDPLIDVESLVGAADAVLLPSSYEGLPNAVIEALACGTPCIVSSAANADGLVSHLRTGVVLADTSSASIASGMLAFARGAEAMRATALALREAFARRFAVQRMVDDTCAVYERVLSTP